RPQRERPRHLSVAKVPRHNLHLAERPRTRHRFGQDVPPPSHRSCRSCATPRRLQEPDEGGALLGGHPAPFAGELVVPAWTSTTLRDGLTVVAAQKPFALQG